MTTRRIPVNVIGPGAVGIGIAILVAESGREVALVGRDSLVRNASLRLKEQDHSVQFPVDGPFDGGYSIITCKAYDLEKVLIANERTLASSECILYLQNGLGLSEKFAKYPNATQGILWVSAERSEKNRALWRTGLRVVLDGNDSRAAGVGGVLTEAGITIVYAENFETEIFKKLMLNLACNPVSALYGIPNAEIHKHHEARRRAILAAEEIAELAQRLGYPVDLDAAEIVDSTAAKLGDFKSSTLQDLEADRPLELEAILLEPIRLADLHRLAFPQIRSLYEDLKKVTKK